MLNAFKDGVTILNEDNLNQMLALQDFSLIYEGTQRDAKTGSGVTENNLANYSYCARFTLTGSTEISRIELDLDRDGLGADLVVQIRSGMDPAAGDDGTLLKEVVVPKEFVPETAAYWSIPINLTGLTSGGQYWLVVQQAGDATNHLDWIGEASQDASYPACYRVGDSGTWTASNALHFKVFRGVDGEIMHTVYAGTGYATLQYEMVDAIPRLKKIYRYLPPSDSAAGGVRDVVTLTWTDGIITQGVM